MAFTRVLEVENRLESATSAGFIMPGNCTVKWKAQMPDQAEILNTDNHGRIVLELSKDDGRTWQHWITADWEGGEHNVDRNGNLVSPSGSASYSDGVPARVRGHVEVPKKVRIGLDIELIDDSSGQSIPVKSR